MVSPGRARLKSPPSPPFQRGEKHWARAGGPAYSWRWAWCCLLALIPALAQAVPPLDDKGRAGYAEFLRAPAHRAFAVAPGGGWSWRGEMPSAEMALQGAVEDCQAHARKRCLAYALDDQVVFDAREWAGAWRPYATRAEAARAPVGLKPGQRFPDITYHDPAGRVRKLSDDLGRVVVLHFWGSWCPPCQREMPDLQTLHGKLKNRPELRFLFLPVREPVARSRDWAKGKGIALPISDGGPTAEKEGAFQLSDGRRIGDRDVARVFPTTYVLDRHGLVLFAQTGPVSDWSSLAPLLNDAAAGSGR
jgi:thiol-disulfide isomerase/thioredoxin